MTKIIQVTKVQGHNKQSNALRTQIPKEIREELRITKGDSLMWQYNGETLTIKKIE